MKKALINLGFLSLSATTLLGEIITPPQLDENSSYINSVTDNYGTIYTVYQDGSDGDGDDDSKRGQLLRYNDNNDSWSIIESIIFSNDNDNLHLPNTFEFRESDIKFDANNKMHIGYIDYSSEYESSTLSYLRYNPEIEPTEDNYFGWESYVPGDNFTFGLDKDNAEWTPYVKDFSLELNSSDIVNIAFINENNLNVSVRYLDDNNTPSDYSDDTFEYLPNSTDIFKANELDMVIDDNVLYIAYSDDVNSKLQVVKYTNNSWNSLESNVSQNSVSDIDMFIGDDKNIYIQYEDGVLNKTVLQKLRRYSPIDFYENDTSIITSISLVYDMNVSYSLSGEDNSSFSISQNGELSFISLKDYENPTDKDSDNIYKVDVLVTNTDTNQSSEKSYNITVLNKDEAPLIADINNSLVTEDSDEFNISLSVVDLEGDDINYTITSSDESIATVDLIDGKILVTPIADAFGVVTIEINATANGLSALKEFNITIENINDIPTIDTIFNNITILEDNGTTPYELNVSDFDGDELNISVESNDTNIITVSKGWSGLLTQGHYDGIGLDFNLTTVQDAYGTAKVTIKVNDGESNISLSFDITVSPVNDAPIVTSTAITTALEDSEYSYTLTTEDIEGSDLTLSVAEGTELPGWLKLSVGFSNSSDWKTVGSAGFSAAEVYDTDIALDSENIPYVVYKDAGNNEYATVMKYSKQNGSWEIVGSAGLSAGAVEYTSIAIDSKDVPYIVYQDKGNDSNATVMKYNENNDSWETMGKAGFSEASVSYTSMAIDSNDTPYVVYQDNEMQGAVTVKRYNSQSELWETVGIEGFSATMASYTSIAIDSNDTPYVAYQDWLDGSNLKATVKRYNKNSNSWESVGNPGLSDGEATYISIAIDSTNTPYIVYKDNANGLKVTVKKYDKDENSWETVGSEGFSEGSVSYPSISIDTKNTPYVVYQETIGSSWPPINRITVMKYENSVWKSVGNSALSEDLSSFSSISMSSNDVPYIIYQDGEKNFNATVKSLSTYPILTGIPTNSDVGAHDVNLTLSDGEDNISYNFTITVSNVNDIPISEDITIYIDEDINKTFSSNDFIFNDEDLNDSVDSIFITSIPSKGSLKLNDINVTVNQELSMNDISNLIYSPVVNEYGTPYTSFNFIANDGEANSSEYSITINVQSVDDLPTFETISNILKIEDSSEFNITLNSNDMDGDIIVYSLSSTNSNIATVELIDGKLVVTPLSNKNGTISVEINATANGQTVTQNFDIEIESINDTPEFTTDLKDITILEDNGTLNYELNVTDIEGDELNITIESNNSTILRVTKSWNSLLNLAEYENIPLDFNLSTVENKYGVVMITINVKDESGGVSTENFTVNITSVNDAPIINYISDRIYYKNFDDKNISLSVNDPDGDMITYDIKVENETLFNLTRVENILTISSFNEVYGNSDINISVSDGELNSSKTFNVMILSLQSDDVIEEVSETQIIEDENKTTYSNQIGENVTIERIENNNGTVSHQITVGENVTQASSEINGSIVEAAGDGVHTYYEDTNKGVKVEANASITGTASHSITSNGKTTNAKSQVPGARTVMKNNNGYVEVETTVDAGESNVTVTAKENGYATHEIKGNGYDSKTTSQIAGSETVINDSNVTTTAGNKPSSCNDTYLKAIVETFMNGKTKTKFKYFNCSDDSLSNKELPTSDDEYVEDNNVTVYEDGNKTVIKTQTKVDSNLQF